jgi:catechol 2,3-dioxygenase-like lactoylglutathione lyase family enzyme
VTQEVLLFDHVTIDVADLEASRGFYERALAPLGLSVVMEFPDRLAFGVPGGGKPWFFITARGTPSARGVHVAFSAESRDVVEAFHSAALEAGGTDNGAPGLRPQYHAAYYGGFVLDPDGNNIEATHHG